MAKKGSTTKAISRRIWTDHGLWTVHRGELKPPRGRPPCVKNLFQVVGEKLPWECLSTVRADVKRLGMPHTGVYVAHDSMGYARYVGRGNIFSRLRTQKKAHALELMYFSFYVVADKKHEREIETLLIRAAGPLLQFNDRKKRVTIDPGRIRDYEARTHFYERQRKKGKAKETWRGQTAV